MTKVFINGSSGTTGLRIRERLAARDDLELIILPDAQRHNPAAVKEAINSSDVTFFCLPDDAAREALALVENPDTVVLDTSTAHRTAPGWVYGFPELGRAEAIKKSKRIAVPGCHASGFNALVTPLVQRGALRQGTPLASFSLTGYSGGGKKMIAQYESPDRPADFTAPRQYGLTQAHKHLPEMVSVSGIGVEPGFCPIVAPFYSGMEFTVELFARDLMPGVTAETVKSIYAEEYRGPVVRYEDVSDSGFLSAAAMSGRDDMAVAVYGSGERILLTAVYDNLGKGASGAAVQCMNLAIGCEMTKGLVLKGDDAK